jgi:hypothetical protein
VHGHGCPARRPRRTKARARSSGVPARECARCRAHEAPALASEASWRPTHPGAAYAPGERSTAAHGHIGQGAVLWQARWSWQSRAEPWTIADVVLHAGARECARCQAHEAPGLASKASWRPTHPGAALRARRAERPRTGTEARARPPGMPGGASARDARRARGCPRQAGPGTQAPPYARSAAWAPRHGCPARRPQAHAGPGAVPGMPGRARPGPRAHVRGLRSPAAEPPGTLAYWPPRAQAAPRSGESGG